MHRRLFAAWWRAIGLIGLAVWLAGCGSGKPPFVSSTVTVVVGAGEKADEPQSVVSGIMSLEADGERLLNEVACTDTGGRWLLKRTVTLEREVKAGTKAKLTVKGPKGLETFDIKFSDSMIPRKQKLELWGTPVEVQCYASVGNKWGLLLFVQPQ